jgi:hypothetical protein
MVAAAAFSLDDPDDLTPVLLAERQSGTGTLRDGSFHRLAFRLFLLLLHSFENGLNIGGRNRNMDPLEQERTHSQIRVIESIPSSGTSVVDPVLDPEFQVNPVPNPDLGF